MQIDAANDLDDKLDRGGGPHTTFARTSPSKLYVWPR